MFSNTFSSSLEDTKTDYDEEIKVIIVGETGVGKSNIILRYNGGQFDPNSLPSNVLHLSLSIIPLEKRFIELMFGILLDKKNIIP